MGATASRIYKNLKEFGPRKANVLRGLAKSEADFERAVGQLFLVGVVTWQGRGKGRKLASKS